MKSSKEKDQLDFTEVVTTDELSKELGIPKEALISMSGVSIHGENTSSDIEESIFKSADKEDIKKIMDDNKKDDNKENNKEKDDDKKKDIKNSNKENDDDENDNKKNDKTVKYDINTAIKEAFDNNIFTFDPNDIDEDKVLDILNSGGKNALLQYFIDAEISYRDELRKKEIEEDQIEYTELKDSGVDPDTAKRLMLEKIEFDKISESDIENNEDLAVDVLKKYYNKTIQNPTPEKINKLIKGLQASGDDIDTAKDVLNEMKELLKKEREDAKKLVAEEEKKNAELAKEQSKKMEEYIDNIDKILPDMEVNSNIKKKIKNALLGSVKLKNGNVTNPVTAKLMEDPMKFNAIVGYMYAMGFFDSKTEPFIKIGETKAINKLDKILKSSEGKIKGFSRNNDIDDNEDNLMLKFLNEKKKV